MKEEEERREGEEREVEKINEGRKEWQYEVEEEEEEKVDREQQEKGTSLTTPQCASWRTSMDFYSQCLTSYNAEAKWMSKNTYVHSPYWANGS